MNLEALRKRLEFDVQDRVNRSYANCQSERVQKQIERLNEADKVTWFAGHHNGFNAGLDSENARLRPYLDQMLKVVEASQEAVNAQLRTFGTINGNHASAYAAQLIQKELAALDRMVSE